MPRRRPSPRAHARTATRSSSRTIVTIPEASSAEAPREMPAQDRSRPRSHVHELTWASFDRYVAELARQVSRSFRPQAVVGVAHGGVFVGDALASALEIDFYPVRISRRSRDHVILKSPKLTGEMPREIKGKRVLIVDDIAASGDTLELALALAKKVGARQLKTACLVRREAGYQPDWSCMTTAELVVFPWDYATVAEEFGRNPDRARA